MTHPNPSSAPEGVIPEARLREIIDGCEGVTPGPWVKDYGGTIGHIKSIAEAKKPSTPTVARYDVWKGAGFRGSVSVEEEQANAALIAASVNALPELIAAVRELQDALRNLMDCSSAIALVGADQQDDEAIEAFEMFDAARRRARRSLIEGQQP